MKSVGLRGRNRERIIFSLELLKNVWKFMRGRNIQLMGTVTHLGFNNFQPGNSYPMISHLAYLIG